MKSREETREWLKERIKQDAEWLEHVRGLEKDSEWVQPSSSEIEKRIEMYRAILAALEELEVPRLPNPEPRTEREKAEEAMSDISKRRKGRYKLVYDKATKTIKPELNVAALEPVTEEEKN